MDVVYVLCTVILLIFNFTGIRADGHQHCPDVPNKNETTFVFKDKCYHIRQEEDVFTGWDNAHSDCRSRGGHLFVVDNQEEQDAIHQELDIIAMTHSLWMGVRKWDGTWASVKGALTYENWSPLDPGTGDCAIFNLKETGTWTKEPCSDVKWYFGYVCQHDKDSASVAGGHRTQGCLVLGVISMIFSALCAVLLSRSD